MEDNKKNRYTDDELLIGRNPVSEALSSGRPLIKVMIAKGGVNGSAVEIAAKAKKAGVPVQEVDRKKLDYMTSGAAHQGIAALCAVKEYSSVEDILELAESRGEAPFIIILDEIEDPHNLGAIIRSAECAGAHGVIVKKRRSAGLTYTAYKASAGALEYLPVARVTNIADTIEQGAATQRATRRARQGVAKSRRGLPAHRLRRSCGSGDRQRGQGHIAARP